MMMWVFVLLVQVSMLTKSGATLWSSRNNGCFIKYTDTADKSCYIALDDTLYQVANADTVDALGFSWNDLVYIQTSYTRGMSIGTSLNIYNISLNISEFRDRIKHAYRLPVYVPVPTTADHAFALIETTTRRLQDFVRSNRLKPKCNSGAIFTLAKYQFGRFGTYLTQIMHMTHTR